MDQAITGFRSIAYDILRAHYDCDEIPDYVKNTIPSGKTYDNYTDEAIARQITQMLYIVGKWFEMFQSDSEHPGEKIVQSTMEVLGVMFIEACDSDEKHYKNG